MDVEPAIEARHGSGLDRAAAAVREHLHEGRYSLEEIEGLVGMPLDKLYADSSVSLKVRAVHTNVHTHHVCPSMQGS